MTFAVGLPRFEQPLAEARNEIRARLSRKRSGSIYVYTNSTEDHSSSCGRGDASAGKAGIVQCGCMWEKQRSMINLQ